MTSPAPQTPKRRRGGALGRLSGVLLLVGTLVGVAAVPVGAVLTAGADWTKKQQDQLPPQLLAPPTAQVTRIYADDGKTLITTFYDEDRHDVALGQISTTMRNAIVAAEDTRFFEHGGVDARGVARAFVNDTQDGGAEQGASTLTMQVVRNVLKEDPNLTPQERIDATADTPARKLKEAEYAIELEHRLTKQQILQNYLNIVYFGGGAYGVEAAARRIFGTTPAKLDLAESALIAGIVQNPDADNPISGDKTKARARQEYVLAAMAKAGTITPAQQQAALKEKLKYSGKTQPNGCIDASGAADGWGFFCDYVQRWWDQQPEFGKTVDDREDALRRGGYTVVTTLDPKIQKEAAKESRAVYGLNNKKTLPIAVVEPGSGKVAALAVNRHFSNGNSTSETTNPLVSGGGTVYGYPSGSTFKMFTMLTALEDGMPLNSVYDSPAKLQTPWPDGGPGNCNGFYCPGNDNPSWMDGPRSMWNGFGRSVNTFFVHLEEQVGPAAVVAEAKKLGIGFSAPADAQLAKNPDSWGSFTLGVIDVTPLELASAYATVAAEGTYCKPLPIQSIKDANGRTVPVATDCKQVISPDVARAATDAARCPVGEQSTYGKCDGGTAAQVSGIMGGRPVAGKTGSTENNMTETFVGFTRTYAAAGIANDPVNPSDHVGSSVEGLVVNAVAHTLNTAVGSSDYPDFTPPSSAIALGN